MFIAVFITVFIAAVAGTGEWDGGTTAGHAAVAWTDWRCGRLWYGTCDGSRTVGR